MASKLQENSEVNVDLKRENLVNRNLCQHEINVVRNQFMFLYNTTV
jgi:hypothetical protein